MGAVLLGFQRCCADHAAALAGKVVYRVVQRKPIVPQDDTALFPTEPAGEFVPLHVVEKIS